MLPYATLSLADPCCAAGTWTNALTKTHLMTELLQMTTSGSTLQLVTCGGVFDYQTRSYESNLVVYTRLVDH